MKDPIKFDDDVYQITGCAMTVLNKLGHGYSEKVYENALAIELRKQQIPFKQQQAFDVFYENQCVGTYIPDLIINDQIIVELKTIPKITDNEFGQVINYLKATNHKIGLILNFRNSKLEWKRVVL